MTGPSPFVQEGMPGAEKGAGPGESPGSLGSMEPERSGGGRGRREDDGEGSAAVSEGHRPASTTSPVPGPAGIHRLLTWRNAILGGVGALSLVGVAVVVYFIMWSTGIGPVGNLVAQGVIQQGDRVVLATFTDRTDEGLGAVTGPFGWTWPRARS